MYISYDLHKFLSFLLIIEALRRCYDNYNFQENLELIILTHQEK